MAQARAIDQTPIQAQAARAAVRAATHGDEAQAVSALLTSLTLDDTARDAITGTAQAIVSRSRALKNERGTLDAFLAEFGLSNQEGVALMCLAEALLRVPDADTQDALIAEKIRSGDWASHKGHSESPFVNASVWALMLTGRVIDLDQAIERDPGQWVRSLVTRAGEPVIRQAVAQAMRIMGRQFVFGRTIDEALARRGRLPADQKLFSFDMLGEGARTAADADRYFETYRLAIEAVGRATGGDGDHLNSRSSVSIKLSALHPRYEQVKSDRVMAELLPRVTELARLAADLDMQLTIDAEEADRLDLSLTVLEAVARDPALAGWQGLGLAVQAYQKRAPAVIDWLGVLARDTSRCLPVRLVKGAYWDSEIKHAQELGFADYPVYTRKAATDLGYLVCAGKLLAGGPAFHPQFATHNAHTIAAIHHMAGTAPYEFQRLHGMGELLYRAAGDVVGAPLVARTYAPVGAHQDLLPYLVRRLLENGANSSFVNRFMDADVPVAEVAHDPVGIVEDAPKARHGAIPKPAHIYGDERENSAGLDLTNPAATDPLLADLAGQRQTVYDGPSLVSGAPAGGEPVPVRAPHDGSLVGHTRPARPQDIDAALTAAGAAQPAWDTDGGAKRGAVLRHMGGLLEEHRLTLLDLMTREAGKTLADGIAEVREAVDFCRYYAARAEQDFAVPARLPGPTGERNQLSLHGRGTFVCISPWNFPLAIFTGQIAAALAAGNAVLAKPAEQTPLVASYAVGLFHRAGVPADVLHLLAGDGAVGASLVADERIAGVAFTGSTATAKAINRTLAERDGPIVPLIAETGGQNAMIVDSTALPEQVADDVMMSAFSSAGQRCSALRVLFVQDAVADRILDILTGALAERQVGDPAALDTDVGPIIDAQALDRLAAHVERMTREARLVAKGAVPADLTGSYLAPHIFEIDGLDRLDGEVFGPILHVIRYRSGELDQVLAAIQATGFGLTFGVHSRLEGRWAELFAGTRVGNMYVNRNMIGAVVGVQPFGGQGLSGTGPKAGGPHYVHRFATERVLTVNTAAIGGNMDLFRLEEGE